MFPPDGFQYRVVEDVVLPLGERTPCLHLYIPVPVPCDLRFPLVERVQLDLVDERHRLLVQQEVGQAVGPEVADADGLYPPCLVILLQGTPCPVHVAHRPMEQVDVHVVEAHRFQRPVEGSHRLVVAAHLGRFQLGGDEHLPARKPAVAHGPAHRFLVLIAGSRVNQAVARFHGVDDRPFALLRVGDPEHSVSQCRDSHSVG